MARARGTKSYQPLVQGLNTEASPLDFPQGATQDELNFVHESNDNKRVKRKGFSNDFTFTWDATTELADPLAVIEPAKMYWWEAAGVWLLVCLSKTVNPSSENRSVIVFVYDVSAFQLGVITATRGDVVRLEADDLHVSVTEVREDLVMVTFNGYENTLLLSHEYETTTASPRQIKPFLGRVAFRDFVVLTTDNPAIGRKSQDGAGVPSVDDNYQYNIINAGWDREDMPLQTAGGAKASPLDHIAGLGAGTYYPSMYESPNSYIKIDAGTRVFDRTAYVNSQDQFSGQSAVGSQVTRLNDPQFRSLFTTKTPDSLVALTPIDLT